MAAPKDNEAGRLDVELVRRGLMVSRAQAKAAIEANGGQVTNGPMQVPGDDWIVQGIDPQGAAFSLVGGK